MDKIKTAVVGVGHLGRHHARWYKNLPDSELVGVFDIDAGKSGAVAEELGIPALVSLDELIAKAEAVSVAVPTLNHYEVTEILLKNKVHCLVEKPIASTSEQAAAMIALAKKNNVVMTVGQIERFNPAVQAIMEHKINPRFIEAHRLAAFNPRGTDVAVILDLMIHDIDLTLHLIKSKIARIEAAAVAVISDTADIANARLTFENGAVANLTASRISLRPMRKLRIFQKSGYYSLDLAEKRADIYRLADDVPANAVGMRIPLGDSGREIFYAKAGSSDSDMLRAELQAFLKSIHDNLQPPVAAEEAAEALRVAIEVERVGLSEIKE
jgi:predicted dehydrogenase